MGRVFLLLLRKEGQRRRGGTRTPRSQKAAGSRREQLGCVLDITL